MPWANNRPLIRLTCATSVLRSRQSLRRSSSSGLGALTMVQTRGSPRLYARSVRSSASPSMRSVFALRRRREVKIEAASTHVTLNARPLQHAMDPEAGLDGFLNGDDREARACPGVHLVPQLGEVGHQLRNIAATHRMLGHFVSATRHERSDQPRRTG